MWRVPALIKWVNRGPDIKLYNPRTGEWLFLEGLYKDLFLLIAARRDPLVQVPVLATKYGTTTAEMQARVHAVLQELADAQLVEEDLELHVL